MSYVLRTLGLADVLMFGTAFSFTYTVLGYVEEIGKNFIKIKIEESTYEKIERLSFTPKNNSLVKLASQLVKDNEAKINQLQKDLKSKTHEKIAAVIAKMRDLNCECRKKFEKRFEEGTKSNILSLQNANAKLTDFMQYKYMEVANKLKADFRIFTGSNSAVFLLILLVSFFKPKAMTHLFLPGILLIISTLVCSYFYLFEQNWFFTIIYDSYLGWGYIIYLSVVFGFLCDIIFNAARVTTEILNAIFNAIGSALSVASC